MRPLVDYGKRSRCTPPVAGLPLGEIRARALSRRRRRRLVEVGAICLIVAAGTVVAVQRLADRSGDETITAGPSTASEERGAGPSTTSETGGGPSLDSGSTAAGSNNAGIAISLEPSTHSRSGGTVTLTVENRTGTEISHGLGAQLQARSGDEWVTVYHLSGTSGPPIEPRAVPADEELAFPHIGFTVPAGTSGTPLFFEFPRLDPGSYRFVKADFLDRNTEKSMEPVAAVFEVEA